MSPQDQARRSADMLREVLDLGFSDARTTEDIFTGISHPMPSGRIYGGQVLGQAVVAAQRTLPEERAAHSMHGYFLRPGNAQEGVTFSVDRIHDGRSFSTRRCQAFQNGVPIFSMIASFQDENPGVDHAAAMPEGIPGPEEVASDEELLGGVGSLSERVFAERPVELRHVQSPILQAPDPSHTPQQAVWMRLRAPLPADPVLHRAALAYCSDMTIQESILRAHGLSWNTPGLNVASLDHALWWHRPGRVDDWLLFVQESPNARGGRGLATGRIYDRAGTLIASVAQEIMIRVP